MKLIYKENRCEEERYKSSFISDYIYRFYSLGKDTIIDKLILNSQNDRKRIQNILIGVSFQMGICSFIKKVN